MSFLCRFDRLKWTLAIPNHTHTHTPAGVSLQPTSSSCFSVGLALSALPRAAAPSGPTKQPVKSRLWRKRFSHSAWETVDHARRWDNNFAVSCMLQRYVCIDNSNALQWFFFVQLLIFRNYWRKSFLEIEFSAGFVAGKHNSEPLSFSKRLNLHRWTDESAKHKHWCQVTEW